MTAMTLYLAEAHRAELRASRQQSGYGNLCGLLAEIGQVLKGSVLPVGGANDGLGHNLRRDIGLD